MLEKDYNNNYKEKEVNEKNKICNEKEEEDNNNSFEEMVKKMRKEFGSDLDKISDERIKEKLEENEGDYERTVMDLILSVCSLIKGNK